MLRIGHRFIDALHVAAVEDDAGRAGVDEPRARRVRGRRRSRSASPRRWSGGTLASGPQRPALAAMWKTVVAALDGAGDDRGVGDVALDLLDARAPEDEGRAAATGCGPARPRSRSRLISGRAQEPAAAGHQHCRVHLAS